MGGCTTRLVDVKDVPIPAMVQITKPGVEIPPEMRVLIGPWSGKWDNSLPHVLIIKKIASPEEVSVDYCLKGRKTCESITGKFKDGKVLTFSLQSGSVLEYWMNPMGKLEGKYQRQNVDAFSITLMDKLAE